MGRAIATLARVRRNGLVVSGSGKIAKSSTQTRALRIVGLALMLSSTVLVAAVNQNTIYISATQRLQAATISSDGRTLAFQAVTFPINNGEGGAGSLQSPCDIYLYSIESRRIWKITNSVETGVSFSEPVWSPDGTQIALLGLHDNRVSPWLYSLTSRKLNRLSLDNVAFPDRAPYPDARIVWLSDHQLVWSTMPADVVWYGDRRWRAPQIFADWQRAAVGNEVTKRVLESGAPGQNIPAGKLVSYDTASHRENQIIAAHALVSPTIGDPGNYAVFLDRGTGEYDSEHLIADNEDEPRNYIIGLGTNRGLTTFDLGDFSPLVEGKFGAMPEGVVRWSPSKSQVVVYGARNSNRSSAVPETRRFRRIGARLEESPLEGIETIADLAPDSQRAYMGPLPIAWDGEDRLAVFGRAKSAAPSARKEWWLETTSEKMECLTCSLPEVPPEIVWVDSYRSFVGASKGHVWKLKAGSHPVDDITDSLKCDEVLGPSAVAQDLDDTLAVQVKCRGKNALKIFGSHIHSPLDVPLSDQDGMVYGYSGKSGVVIIGNESAVRIVRAGAPEQVTIALSDSRVGAKGNEVKPIGIHYSGADGSPLIAVLIPPADGSVKRPFPTIVDQYPGRVYSKGSLQAWSLAPDENMDLPIGGWTHHGYAVMLPSIPWSHDVRKTNEPLRYFRDTIVNAVDAGVALGLIDQQRVGLYGISFGGYAATGVIGETTIFRAAVAAAPITDLFSEYLGQAQPLLSRPHPSGFLWTENGQEDLQGLPWDDPQLFLRNSPFMHVKEVNTPLLIIAGDLDTVVPFEQSEEMYLALFRLNKRARFLHYVGEGHGLSGANSRDAFAETLNWYDTFLLGKEPVPGSQAHGKAK